MKETMKAKFASYYKYKFTFYAENGLTYVIGGDHNDIYRLLVYPVVEMTKDGDTWFLDGLECVEVGKTRYEHN